MALKSKPVSALKIKDQIFDVLALVISIDKPVSEQNDSCIFCTHGGNSMENCRKDFKNVHEEAEMLSQQVFNRFDSNFVHLKDPSYDELAQTFKIMQK